MSRLRVSLAASRDLEEIYHYIARDNPRAAARLHARLFERFNLLASQPMLGQSRDDLRPGLREMTVGKYVICFTPSADLVQIQRVLHGARDISQFF
jgi:toxin ParE1/3/4